MRIVTIIAILSFLSFPLHAEDVYTPKNHEFQALVSSVRLNTELIAQGKKQSDEVSVTVPAILFDEPLRIADVRNVLPHSLKEINTLIAYTKANIEGSAEDVLSFWAVDERKEKAELLSDPDMFKANRDYHNKYPGLTIVGLVFQDTTTSVLMERFGRIMGITVKKENGNFYVTDRPHNDLDLAIIEASLSQ